MSSGEIRALLPSEGLYSFQPAGWRKQRDAIARRELSGKRGPKGRSESAKRVEELERENARLRKKLEQAETIISVQKSLGTSGDSGTAERSVDQPTWKGA